jgi:hypothetical protein
MPNIHRGQYKPIRTVWHRPSVAAVSTIWQAIPTFLTLLLTLYLLGSLSSLALAEATLRDDGHNEVVVRERMPWGWRYFFYSISTRWPRHNEVSFIAAGRGVLTWSLYTSRESSNGKPFWLSPHLAFLGGQCSKDIFTMSLSCTRKFTFTPPCRLNMHLAFCTIRN